MKERNYTIDFLKLTAMVAVVLIHTSTSFLDRTKIFSFEFDTLLVINQLARFAVPLFFAVSGYLLTSRYKTISSPLAFYKKRARLLIPYTFWIFVYYLIVFPNPWKSIFTLKFLNDYLTGDPSYQLYFIPTLFVLYLIFPIVLQYKKYVLTGKFLFVLFMIETFILSLSYFTNHSIHIYPILLLAFYNLFPFLVGALAGQHETKAALIIKKGYTFFLGSSVIFGIAIMSEVFIMFAKTGIDNYLRNQWRMSVMLYSFASGALLTVIYEKYLEKWNKQILKLSMLSFGVYFVHVAILQYYLVIIDKYKFYNFGSFILGFVVVTVFSFAFNWVGSKIPYLRTLLGARTS